MFTSIDYLTPEKSFELIRKLKNLKHKLLAMIMLDAGLRVSEAISLKLRNFNFKKRLIIVESLKKRGTKKNRAIPISNRLYNTLADYIHQNNLSDHHQYMFPNKHDRSKHITRQAVFVALKRFKFRNTGFANLHPHALRHTFATNLLANDTQLVHIKEMLGHQSYDTTLIYTHVPTEVLRNQIEKSTSIKPTLWQKLTSIFYPEQKKVINLRPEGAQFIIGRNKEIQQLTALAQKGVNTIILGPIGSGKSELLQQINLESKVLRVDDMTDFKNTLINALIFLFNNDKEAVFNLMYPKLNLEHAQVKLTRHSAVSLARQLISLTDRHEYVLLIDNVDRITPRYIKILEILKDHFTIITTAREVPINKSSFLWNFETLRLKNLNRAESLELIHRLSYDLEVEDLSMFRNHIWEQSTRNPRVIFELVERFRKEAFISNDVVRKVRHYGSLREIDMSVVVILALGTMAVLRYLAIETGDTSLKFFGGAALVFLLIFRNVVHITKRKVY